MDMSPASATPGTPTPGESPGEAPAWTGDAVDYDAWFDSPWGRHAFAVESAAIVRAAGPVGRGRAMDVGCGTGRFSAALAGCAVTGVDPDPGMLRLARGRTTAGCARASIEHLPFPDGCFDVALAVTVLEFVPDPAAAFAELARVTRRGGRIVVGALNPRSPWGLANHRRLRSGTWCQARFLTRPELRRLAAPHGTPVLHGSLSAPRLLPGLPLIEALGRLVPSVGAFQVLVVDRVDP